MNFNDGLWYAIAIVVLSGLTMIGINQNHFRSMHIGMQIRVSLCSLIYRKSLKLSQRALRQAAVINLLSNDVNRFDNLALFANSLWSAPLMTIAIAYFLWQQARWAGIIGIVVLLFIVSIQCKRKIKLNPGQNTHNFYIFQHIIVNLLPNFDCKPLCGLINV